ncbi:carbonic anhydrase [Candidatus Magnetomonas plexicatena]|uniref:carbonic anhydrase n=1 Tax=Candidatus Magnetomonas plexicatena TaxID=2552947 RepID=UPI00110110EB|nr:carbonic anhydrase [Nitrospirales bacterium LBB_01]
MERRDFIKLAVAAVAFSASIPKLVFADKDFEAEVKKLMEGNERFTKGEFKQRDSSSAKLSELSKGQHPFAVIVTCSDSRVDPEIVFDEDLGEIFVIRTAGNVVDKIALGSIEYAVEHLHSPIVVVVGHESCGAVKATLEAKGKVHGNIGSIVDKILPAVHTAKKNTKAGGDVLYNAIIENVRNVTREISTKSPVVAKELKEGKVNVLGAYYSISTGKIIRV